VITRTRPSSVITGDPAASSPKCRCSISRQEAIPGGHLALGDGRSYRLVRSWSRCRVVVDIPASVTELPAGAGDDTGQHLPAGAFQLPNDVRAPYFLGAAPPPGDGRHRYVIVVQAIDVEHVGQLGVEASSTPALLGFGINNGGHLLGRAVLIPWAEVPAT
jgi:Phosphatidylethanolamine-binding protein